GGGVWAEGGRWEAVKGPAKGRAGNQLQRKTRPLRPPKKQAQRLPLKHPVRKRKTRKQAAQQWTRLQRARSRASHFHPRCEDSSAKRASMRRRLPPPGGADG